MDSGHSKPDLILVYAPGSEITVTGLEDRVRVLGVTIAVDRAVSYFVAWWSNGQRHTAEVEECEVSPWQKDSPMTIRIGFQPPGGL